MKVHSARREATKLVEQTFKKIWKIMVLGFGLLY